jgi:signal transduction histidine kinase
VVVGYDVGSDRIVYRVRAAGIDLTVEARRTVFEEFRDSVGPASQHVTGLGFALSRQLARLLGGDVAVTSDAATGTTFTAELPLEYDPAQSKA